MISRMTNQYADLLSKWACWPLILPLMVGCSLSHPPGERQGTSVQVIPVQQSMAIRVAPSSQLEAVWHRLNRRVGEDIGLFLGEKVTLRWATPEGKALADRLTTKLLRMGKSKALLVEEHVDPFNVKQATSTAERADLTVIVAQQLIRTSVCPPAKIGHFGETPLGCYVDNHRWVSVRFPEHLLAVPGESDAPLKTALSSVSEYTQEETLLNSAGAKEATAEPVGQSGLDEKAQ